MDNLMQPFSLRVSEILDHAARYHPRRKIISRNVEGPIVETNWSSVRAKAKKLSKALQKLDIKKGDRIGVMAWNTARHLELWYGIPGSGAINHTLNPRLFIKQLTYIINHAEDKILMVDLDLIKILEEILPTCKTVKHAIILTDKANMPASNSPNLICYEELVSNEDYDSAETVMNINSSNNEEKHVEASVEEYYAYEENTGTDDFTTTGFLSPINIL